MSAATLDILIEKYATFKLDLQIKNGSGDTAVPADITGYTPRMQIRAQATDIEVLFDLSTTNNRIVVTDALNGLMYVTIAATDTTSIGWTSAVYDLVLIGATETRRILQGKVTISEGVTR